MSKQINWEEPLSEKEEAWAMQFSVMHPLVEANKAATAPLEELDEDQDAEIENLPEDNYEEAGVTADSLRSELKDRGLDTTGKKPELVARLRADDAAKAAQASA